MASEHLWPLPSEQELGRVPKGDWRQANADAQSEVSVRSMCCEIPAVPQPDAPCDETVHSSSVFDNSGFFGKSSVFDNSGFFGKSSASCESSVFDNSSASGESAVFDTSGIIHTSAILFPEPVRVVATELMTLHELDALLVTAHVRV